VKQHVVVVERREHRHPARKEVNRVMKRGREKVVDDPGGVGMQIVREQRVCLACREES
jgi:hypothetical protein